MADKEWHIVKKAFLGVPTWIGVFFHQVLFQLFHWSSSWSWLSLGMCLFRMDVTYYDKFFLLKEKFNCLFFSVYSEGCTAIMLIHHVFIHLPASPVPVNNPSQPVVSETLPSNCLIPIPPDFPGLGSSCKCVLCEWPLRLKAVFSRLVHTIASQCLPPFRAEWCPIGQIQYPCFPVRQLMGTGIVSTLGFWECSCEHRFPFPSSIYVGANCWQLTAVPLCSSLAVGEGSSSHPTTTTDVWFQIYFYSLRISYIVFLIIFIPNILPNASQIYLQLCVFFF